MIVPSLDWTLLREFSHHRPTIVYIISHFELTGSVFSASAIHGGGHESYRAHLNFVGHACSWVGSGQSWLQITLPTANYVVLGALIKQRCDASSQYATRVKITTSVDGLSWQIVIGSEDVIYDVYNGQGIYSVWYPKAYANRYWRIHALSYSQYPSMKADLIGHK